MKLSVLVPTYRRPEDLRRCLAALATQTRPPDQVVVVVRDSDLESHATAKKAAIELEGLPLEIAMVHASGMIAALNVGLLVMTGDVLCFTDDDAEPLTDWLERIEAHYRDPDVVGVGGRDLLVRKPETIDQKCSVVGRRSWYGRFVGNHHMALEPARPVTVDVLKGVNMSFRATAVAGFRFDEAFVVQGNTCNELDICFVARKTGGRLVYDPAIRVRHYARERVGQPSREDVIQFYDYSHNLTYVLLKHLNWWRRLTFLAYIFLVGQRASWGPVTLAAELILWRRRPPWVEVRYSFLGKLAGVRSYLRTLAPTTARREGP